MNTAGSRPRPPSPQSNQVEQDIQQAGATASSVATAQLQPPAGAPCSNFAEWFAAYGEPGPPAAAGLMTNFEKSPKIYGGTNHHRGQADAYRAPLEIGLLSLQKAPKYLAFLKLHAENENDSPGQASAAS